jgi:hypothetical protein
MEVTTRVFVGGLMVIAAMVGLFYHVEYSGWVLFVGILAVIG